MERYDKKVHKDATYLRGEVMWNGMQCINKTKMNREIAEKDPFQGFYVVYEGWLPILQKANDPTVQKYLTRFANVYFRER